jgi:hypothetical protein
MRAQLDFRGLFFPASLGAPAPGALFRPTAAAVLFVERDDVKSPSVT